jgi:hypothetical protein
VVVAERNLGIVLSSMEAAGHLHWPAGRFAIIDLNLFDYFAKQEGANYAPSVTSIIC